MALPQGDNVADAPVSNFAPGPNLEQIAVDNQAPPVASSDTIKEANDQFVASLGLQPSENFFGPPDAKDPADDQIEVPVHTPSEVDTNPTREPHTEGDEKKLSLENQGRLTELKIAGETGYNENYGDLAATQKALQAQADKYGTNPDGSPKVNIMAYQNREDPAETSFYASFGGDKLAHSVNREFLEFSRKHGTEYPARNVGHVGTVIGGNGERV